MLPKKLFLFFLSTLAFVWSPESLGQNKAITQIIVQKQDSSWGTNVAQSLLNHLYLQIRLGKITGFTDVTCKQKIQPNEIQLIEKYYQKRLDSADGFFLYEQWNFENDSMRIFQGGLSIILKRMESVPGKKGKSLQELKNIELIYFPYSQLRNDLQHAIIPANMNGNCEIHFDEWIQKRGFDGQITFFEGRFFNEKQGTEFEEKIKNKYHLTEKNTLGSSQKMELFLYANSLKYDPLGKEICDLVSQYFVEKPEEYFNIFPNSANDFINFEFPTIEQLIVRRILSWKEDELISAPKDVIILYSKGIQPDTIAFSNLLHLQLSFQNLPISTYLATSAKERLFQINSTPIPRALAPRFYDLLENPANQSMWNDLGKKLKEYEVLLD